MTESYDISIRVVSQQGHCEAGHKAGDEWLVKSDKCHTPPGLCMFAWNALSPLLTALMFGAAFPWETDPEGAQLACIDAENPVVFALRRVRR